MGNTYYVAADTGSDSNTGVSIAAAVQTLHRALVLAQNGDTVYVKPGTYHEQIVFPGLTAPTDKVTFLGDVNGTVFGVQGSVVVDGTGVQTSSSMGAAIQANSGIANVGWYIFDSFTWQNWSNFQNSPNSSTVETDGVNIIPKMGGLLLMNNATARVHFRNCTVKTISTVAGSSTYSKGGLVFHNAGHFLFQNCQIGAGTSIAATYGSLVWYNCVIASGTMSNQFKMEFLGCTFTNTYGNTDFVGYGTNSSTPAVFCTTIFKDCKWPSQGHQIFLLTSGFGEITMDNVFINMTASVTIYSALNPNVASGSTSVYTNYLYGSVTITFKNSQILTVNTSTIWDFILDGYGNHIFMENTEVKNSTLATSSSSFRRYFLQLSSTYTSGASAVFKGCNINGEVWCSDGYTTMVAEDCIFFGMTVGPVYSSGTYASYTFRRCLFAGTGYSTGATAGLVVPGSTNMFTVKDSVVTSCGNTQYSIYVNNTAGGVCHFDNLLAWGNALEGFGGATSWSAYMTRTAGATADMVRGYDPVTTPEVLVPEKNAPLNGTMSAKVPVWGRGRGKFKLLGQSGKTYTITMTVQKSWQGDYVPTSPSVIGGSFVRVGEQDDCFVALQDTTASQTVTITFKPTYSGFHDVEVFGSQNTTAKPTGSRYNIVGGYNQDYILIDDITVAESA